MGFGLTLNPFNETKQIGAVVMVNHNVKDQMISQGSQFISINSSPCKSYAFDRIKNMCRNATLPTTIKFLNTYKPSSPKPSPKPSSYTKPATSPKPTKKIRKQNKQNSPRYSTKNKPNSPSLPTNNSSE